MHIINIDNQIKGWALIAIHRNKYLTTDVVNDYFAIKNRRQTVFSNFTLLYFILR